MDFFDNHKKLFGTALALFVGLTILVAILPAINNQKNNAPLPGDEPLTKVEMLGKRSYIANGCVACHTQQVRNVDMDKVWGDRPGIAADYAKNTRMDVWRNTATLMGTERTGPDLTDIGNRQPSEAWNLLHLYQPRAVVAQSIMPAYQWLFEVKNELDSNDVEVNVPDKFRKGIEGKIAATAEALHLVAYLQSLKQTPLPTGNEAPEFLYKKEEKNSIKEGILGSNASKMPDGDALYAKYCQSCHQANGEGLAGAFPPLKDSKIVLGEDLELYVDIIMNGYDARAEYAAMTAVGTANKLSAAEVAAIINHERTSWGNEGETVSTEEIEKLIKIVQEDNKEL